MVLQPSQPSNFQTIIDIMRTQLAGGVQNSQPYESLLIIQAEKTLYKIVLLVWFSKFANRVSS